MKLIRLTDELLINPEHVAVVKKTLPWRGTKHATIIHLLNGDCYTVPVEINLVIDYLFGDDHAKTK